MNTDRIRIKRMRENAIMPTRGTKRSSGLDFAVCEDQGLWVRKREKILIPLGWAVEIPEGYVGLLDPRSSWNHLFACGRIDDDFRGEMFAAMPMHAMSHSRIPEPGERIVQLIVVEDKRLEPVEVDELSDTTRGTGGHGSTGRF